MPIKILVAYSADSTYVQTTLDYLTAIAHFTNYDVEYVHVTHNAIMDFDFTAYDVVFHNYCARLCFEGYVSESYRAAMRAFSGLKVLAVQDEYDETNRLRQAIVDLGFHIVLTCVPQEALDYVYPREDFSLVEFVTVFTGYAPDPSAKPRTPIRRLRDRRVVLGYRGRDIGGRYGRLAFDKHEIGRRMREICERRGVPHDIAMDDESRIYGLAWFDFVGDCRAMLGTESGSNVFDFDGSIMRSFQALSAALGRPPGYQEFLAAEPLLEVREREISMGQVSPRVFECAAMRTPMVLFEGVYSGVIAPHEHYIPLAKDFSNAEETLDKLRDIEALGALTERAYRHLIASGQFGYEAFWRRIGAVIAEKLESLPLRRRALEEAPPRAPVVAEKVHLVERPSRAPLGLAHIETRDAQELAYLEAQTARGELDLWVDEVRHLDDAYPGAIDRSVQYAHRLCAVLREQLSDEASGVETFKDRVVEIEEFARGILAAQSAYAVQAEAMWAEWRATEATDAALPRLRALVAFHRERAAAYADEYLRFDAFYMTINGALQQAIADAAREIERRGGARRSKIEALKARLRAAPALYRFIRRLRGLSAARW
jgi:hypothetical protein